MTPPVRELDNLRRGLSSGTITLKPSFPRKGVESWFPYYAGFSAGFVREVLRDLHASSHMRVLDPWNGAGTTTTIADAVGCWAIGVDINPVAAVVAAARLVRADDAAHVGGLAKELLVVAERTPRLSPVSDPLRAWLSFRLASHFRSIEGAVLELLGTPDGQTVDPRQEAPPPLAAFFLLCLIRAAKRFARVCEATNPTWIAPERRGDARPVILDRAFLEMVSACACDIATGPRPSSSYVAIGDSRALPVEDASIDVVITSPPYCTRVDYFRATQFELSAMGIGPSDGICRRLREAAMGTNLMRPTAAGSTEGLPRVVMRFLDAVRSHPSKDSETYYTRTFAQYFSDAHASTRELHRVMRVGGTAVLVVQSSYYKDIRIDLGSLYAALGRASHLAAHVHCRVPVRKVLTSINARANEYVRDRKYTEDVVVMKKVG
jgi:hypothetical protein